MRTKTLLHVEKRKQNERIELVLATTERIETFLPVGLRHDGSGRKQMEDVLSEGCGG